MMTKTRTAAMIAVLALTVVGLHGSAAYARQDLPSVDEILERYIEAIGGEKAIRETKAMRQTGSMEMPAMGMSAEMEVMLAPPNKMRMKMTIPQMGEMNTGFNGEVGWIDNPMTGPMLMDGKQLEQAMDQADFYSDLSYDERYTSMETVEQVEFAGEQAYKVKLIDEQGDEVIEYFSVDSGLKIGFEAEQTSEMGTMLVVNELRDYQDFDGRMIPMTTVSKMAGMEMTMKVNDISFEEIDPSAFELPENIKTLVDKVEGQP